MAVTCGGSAAGEGDLFRLLTSGAWPRPVWPKIRRDVVGFFWTRWNVDYEAG